MNTELICTKELARITSISSSTWSKLRIKGEPHSPPYYKVGRSVRYNYQEVKTWLERQTHQSTSEYTSVKSN